ncbi:hypothetical protein C8R44DRAFT_744505 [Mycena epipterygia]|nr:hypothetical protein C8R44DRAFT_744505 [Mycena epipterygia]
MNETFDILEPQLNGVTEHIHGAKPDALQTMKLRIEHKRARRAVTHLVKMRYPAGISGDLDHLCSQSKARVNTEIFQDRALLSQTTTSTPRHLARKSPNANRILQTVLISIHAVQSPRSYGAVRPRGKNITSAQQHVDLQYRWSSVIVLSDVGRDYAYVWIHGAVFEFSRLLRPVMLLIFFPLPGDLPAGISVPRVMESPLYMSRHVWQRVVPSSTEVDRFKSHAADRSITWVWNQQKWQIASVICSIQLAGLRSETLSRRIKSAPFHDSAIQHVLSQSSKFISPASDKEEARLYSVRALSQTENQESQEKPCERCARKGLLCEYIAVAEESGKSSSGASGGGPSSPTTPSTPHIQRPSRQSGGHFQSDVQIPRPYTALDRPNLNAVNIVSNDFRPLTPFDLRNRRSSESHFPAGATYDAYRYGTMTDHVSRFQSAPHYPPTGLPQQEPTSAAYNAPYTSIRYRINQTYTRGVASALQAHVIVAGFVDRRVANIGHFLVPDTFGRRTRGACIYLLSLDSKAECILRI